MSKKLIEFALMLLLIAFLSKGIMFSLLLGMAASIFKIVWNRLTPLAKNFDRPFESVGIAALAGLVVNLAKLILS